MPKILIVVGTRPEIIKMAPIIQAFRSKGIRPIVLHTGQHYDVEMSSLFFEELGLTQPDVDLNIRSASEPVQIAMMLKGLEKAIETYDPELVLAEGDTNTVATTALLCTKLQTPFGHVEAGLRSFDRTMPEELNRMIADDCADICFAPTESAGINLVREGIQPYRIYVTGNTVVDICLAFMRNPSGISRTSEKISHVSDPFVLLTAHRRENVSTRERLLKIVQAITSLGKIVRIVWPVHPHTRKKLMEFGLWKTLQRRQGITLLKPLGYLDFLTLLSKCSVVLTDSGGVQEEAITLKVPCLTLRTSTERPETVEAGGNILVGVDPKRVCRVVKKILTDDLFSRRMREAVNPYGDGRAGRRIAAISIERCRKGLLSRSPELIGRKIMTCSLLPARLDLKGRTIRQIESSKPSRLVTMVYDRKGKTRYPHRDLILQSGWMLQVLDEVEV